MHVRITDGTREVVLEAEGTTLRTMEATALRLFHAMPDPSSEEVPPGTAHPIGFTLDGVALDSNTERAPDAMDEQLVDPDEG